MRTPPESYVGATAVCFPAGIVLAINEQIELARVDDGGDGGSSANDSSGGGAALGEGAGDPANPTKSDGDSAAAGGADSGCSAAPAPAGGVRGTPFWLVLGGLVVLAWRRRSRAA